MLVTNGELLKAAIQIAKTFKTIVGALQIYQLANLNEMGRGVLPAHPWQQLLS